MRFNNLTGDKFTFEIKDVKVEEKKLDVSLLLDEKISILDIYVTTNKNTHINVEMQIINQYNMTKRTLFYNWIRFINNPNGEGVENMAIADNDIKNARDILTIISGDKELKELAELREKSLKDEISRITGAREAGKLEGIIEAIIENLKDIDTISEELINKIKSQSDMDILKKWNKVSARSNSIKEFIENI